jgi:serine/threonine-protein kinase HipA
MKCLFCYEKLSENEKDFHTLCSKKIFGHPQPPVFPFAENDLEKLALEVLKTQTTIPGVQPKISLHLNSENNKKTPKKFTIVGLWGGYILKPPSSHYLQLPEVEDLTMHLASLAKIKVVPHSLIRLKSGNLAYITKRIDRINNEKIHMEDMCQLTERLTEDKYHGSYEQIGKVIQKFSVNPGLDLVNFCELVLFSFLTGNSDMHLKNFSLLHQPNLGIMLSPAYDLLATALVNPSDDEDLALTLNGKKKKINNKDFSVFFETMKLDKKQQENIFKKMAGSKTKWIAKINESFLNEEFKSEYKLLIDNRFSLLK